MLKLLQLPILLTWLRILLIPFFITLFYLPYHWSYMASATCFSLACITDWLDGYLARKFEQTTKFGAFLDPVADKLIVSVALVLLVGSHGTALLAIPAAVIVVREILVSALREWMAEVGKSAYVKVSLLGKGKTTVQMIAIVALLLQPPILDNWIIRIGYITLYAASFMTLWSMILYLYAAWEQLINS